eukprot:scaffold66855_cov47-Phaeocystis_antarctica.AAC.2
MLGLWSLSLSLSLSVCLSIDLSIYRSIYLSIYRSIDYRRLAAEADEVDDEERRDMVGPLAEGALPEACLPEAEAARRLVGQVSGYQ